MEKPADKQTAAEAPAAAPVLTHSSHTHAPSSSTTAVPLDREEVTVRQTAIDAAEQPWQLREKKRFPASPLDGAVYLF